MHIKVIEKIPEDLCLNVEIILFSYELLLDNRCVGYLKSFIFYGYVTITDEGLQILTYALHSWSLGSYGSLASHTYCDTEHLNHKKHIV